MCNDIDGRNVTCNDAQTLLIFTRTFDNFFDAAFQSVLYFGSSFDQFEEFFGKAFSGKG